MKTVWLENKQVKMIDQRLLPSDEVVVSFTDFRDVAQAIQNMTVRGAPAIGIAAACGLVLAAQENNDTSFMKEASETLAKTRPTAVNLFYALEKMNYLIEQGAPAEDYAEKAQEIAEEDEASCRAIGKNGSNLIDDNDSVLTHCNAGGLATGGFGTAIGIIKQAFRSGKKIHVFVDETRPLLQGARLTAWELSKEGIPYTLITDNMAAHFMAKGKIDKVIVGADRIAANGDTANKIGTYGLAVLCAYHSIPFYVAAPVTTVDLKIDSGKEITIEERSEEEVKTCGGRKTAPETARAANPAFDVTPENLITAIITDKNLIKKPFSEGLKL